METIKEIKEVCDNGLNLICNSLGLEPESESKEHMLKELDDFSIKALKKVLKREKKKLTKKDKL